MAGWQRAAPGDRAKMTRYTWGRVIRRDTCDRVSAEAGTMQVFCPDLARPDLVAAVRPAG